MILTTQQVAEKLNVGSSVIRRLVKENHLKPVNSLKEGKVKFFMKFGSKEINEYVKAGKPGLNGRYKFIERPQPKLELIPKLKMLGVKSFGDRLSAIEHKLDLLIKLWS